MSIQKILDAVNVGYGQVADLIPSKFNFNDQPDYFTFNFYDFPEAYVIFVQSDGKIVAAGYSGLYDEVNSVQYCEVKRFNADGSLDTGFTSARFDGEIYDIKQQSNGKLIVVGYFENVGATYPYSKNKYIARLNTDGTVDSSFVSGNGFDALCNVCKILSDDSIVVGGDFSNYDDNSSLHLVKLSIDGAINTAFSGNIPEFNYVTTIEEDAYHNLYVGGDFPNVYRLTSNGSLDSSFDTGTGFNSPVTSIKIDASGKIMVGGWFTQYKGSDVNPGIVRLETNGNLDASFVMTGVGLYNNLGYDYYCTVNSIAIQNDGKIVVGGNFRNYNSGTVMDPIWSVARGIIRFNSNGTVDTKFGKGFDGYLNSLLVDGSNNIFCAGYFYDYNGKECTSQFNFTNSYLAGCCAKLNSTGVLVGTSLKQNLSPVGISDGGNDLWDGGLYFNTNLTQSYESINEMDSIPYTHSVLSPALSDQQATFDMVVYADAQVNGFDSMNYDFMPKDGSINSSADYFGAGSSYFTQMYPGLFVLAASNINIEEFSITGNLGADGDGSYSGDSFDLTVNGENYAVFYKSNYDSGDPSLVEMIIVSGNLAGIVQQILDPLESEDHILTGLSGRKELYVLAFARFDELDTSLELLTTIATKFLSLFVSFTGIKSCSAHACATSAFKCYVGTTQSCTCSTWKYFYPNCTRLQQALGICNGNAGAYVPAIAVCNQRLF
jgi:uncharacterized delta-60 repeat protein